MNLGTVSFNSIHVKETYFFICCCVYIINTKNTRVGTSKLAVHVIKNMVTSDFYIVYNVCITSS